MNKATVIIVVIIALLAVGGVIFYTSQNTTLPLDNTNPGATNTTGTTNNTDNTGVVQAGVPEVSTNSSVSPTDTTVVVSGKVNPRGAFTSYWYEYGLTSNLGSKTINQIVGSGFTPIPAPSYVINLSKNTSYYFRLVGENQYGKVAGSVYTFKTTEGSPAPVGSVPTVKTINATPVSKTEANLKGEVTPNKAETQYWFEYGKTAELGSVTALSAVGNGSVKVPTSITLSDLASTTTYYFRINAQNQFGTVNGTILNFKTK